MQSSFLHGCQSNGFVVCGTETTVSGAEDSMETNVAAAALLNMESPNNILDEKRMSKLVSIFCNWLVTHFSVFRISSMRQFALNSWFLYIFFLSRKVHAYGTLLESDLTYAPLRPDQMDNSALDVSLDEDTSSMDEIAQKCPLKPQKKNKGDTVVLLFLLARTQELPLVLKFQRCR